MDGLIRDRSMESEVWIMTQPLYVHVHGSAVPAKTVGRVRFAACPRKPREYAEGIVTQRSHKHWLEEEATNLKLDVRSLV